MFLTSTGGALRDDIGLPVRLAGCNAYSLYVRYVSNNQRDAYTQAIDMLAVAGVRVIRIFMDGYDAAGSIGLWETNQSAADAAATAILDYAATRNIGVLWCINWNLKGLVDWKGESVGGTSYTALSNQSSASRLYINALIDHITGAYGSHPALYGWEIANESNILTLPGLSNAQRQTMLRDIATYLRAKDANRIILSGNGHVRTENSGWSNVQGEATLMAAWNPSPIDTWCAHFYMNPGNVPVAEDDEIGFVKRWLDRQCENARGAGKVFVLGEYGNDYASYDEARLTAEATRIVTAIAQSQCQLSFFWNCDISDFSGNQGHCRFWSDHREYTFELLSLLAGIPYSPPPKRLIARGL